MTDTLTPIIVTRQATAHYIALAIQRLDTLTEVT